MKFTPEQLAADENTPPEELTKLAKQSVELATIVAQNANTEPELLIELATSEDFIIRQNVAANPNTPIKTLFSLGAEFPKELLNNPILNLLLLENPNLISEIPIATLRSLIKQDNVPELFIVECAERGADKELLLSMTVNPKTSRHVLEKLIESKFVEVTEAAKLHVNWSGEITEGWQELAEEKIKAIRPLYSGAVVDYLQYERPYLSILAKLGYIPDYLILHWKRHWNVKEVINEIAVSVNTDPSILAELGKDENPRIRRIVAGNSSTPPTTLELLVEDSTEDKSSAIVGYSIQVRSAICQNPNAPEKVLIKLAQDREGCIRRDVAANINLPFSIAELLAQDPEAMVRFDVAKNRNTPACVLAQLSNDKAEKVGLAVASNPNTPIYILEEMILAENGIRSVANKARMALVELENPAIINIQLAARIKILKKIGEEIKIRNTSYNSNSNNTYYVATDPNTPIHVLEDFVKNKAVKIANRMDVISNPNFTTAMLEELLKDKDSRKYLENHRELPEISLKYLLLEKGMACHLAVLSSLEENFDKSLTWIMAGYAKCEYLIVRLIVLLHHKADENALKQKAASIEWLERYAVAQNPNTPLKIVKQLTNDGNKVVRAAAKANLYQLTNKKNC